MKHCLFVQWKKPTDPSRYVIDGMVSEYSGTEIQDKLMKLLAEVPKYKEICNNKGRIDLSPSFRCSYFRTKSFVFHFIEGNFEDTDFAGRKMVYIFMTSETDSVKAVEILKEYSALLGVTPHQEDLVEIRKQNFKEKTHFKSTDLLKKSIIWIIIVTITFPLLFILLNHQNKL